MSQIKCDRCGADATVYLKQTVNGKNKEARLCAKCASACGVNGFQGGEAFSDSFFSDEFFGVAPHFPEFFPKTEKTAPGRTKCPTCGMTLSGFKEKGRFGCGDCYAAFSEEVDFTPFIGKGFRGKPLAAVSGGGQELGDRDEDQTEATPEEKLALLKARLKEAVAQEQYEKAAELRDEIRGLEAK